MNDIRKAWNVDPTKADERKEADAREVARNTRIERSKADAEFFCRYYLHHFFSNPITGQFTGLGDWQKEVIEETRTSKRLAYAAPRGHGKTTFVSFALTLRDLLIQQSVFTIYIGPTATSAADRIQEIRTELENNERIREDFGDLLTGEGVADARADQKLRQQSADLALANGARIVGRGCGQSLRGLKHRELRPDRIILDDVDRDDEVATKERIDKRIKWFRRVVLGLQGAKGMCVFVVGNIIARTTLLTAILAMPSFSSRIYRAIKDDGTPLMPALWTTEALEKVRDEVGTDAFETEYQNNPPSEGSRTFREEWLKKRWTYELLATVSPRKIASLDLSKGKSERSDFQAMVAIQRDDQGNIYIRKADINRRTRRELVQRVFQFSQVMDLGSIVSFVVESNGFQEWFKQELQEESAKQGFDLPIVEQIHTVSKYDRVVKIAPMAEGGRIFFPPEEEEDADMKLLRRQMEEFPDGRHDDGPDALAMAIEESGRLTRETGSEVLDLSIFDRDDGSSYEKFSTAYTGAAL